VSDNGNYGKGMESLSGKALSLFANDNGPHLLERASLVIVFAKCLYVRGGPVLPRPLDKEKPFFWQLIQNFVSAN
jgi:hypothetical protein